MCVDIFIYTCIKSICVHIHTGVITSECKWEGIEEQTDFVKGKNVGKITYVVFKLSTR